MKKITSLSAVLIMAMCAMAQVTFTRVWERSDSAFTETGQNANKKPDYFNDANTRGIAVGKINSNTGIVERVFLPSRNALGNVVRVLDINTGGDVKSLDMTGVSGGTFPISDAGITQDGVLLVSNLSGTGGAADLKIYKWDNEDAVPVVAITCTLTGRYGDKISVTGNYGDGSARIYVIGGGVLTNLNVQYFKMEQVAGVWKFKQTPDVLATTITAASSNFHQFNPGPDGGFYFRSVGLNDFQQIKSDFTANIGNTHPATIAQGSTVPVFIKTVGGFDYACYLRYGSAATSRLSTNQIEVIKIDRSLGITSATVLAASSSFGKIAPGNGAGHVAVKNMPNGDVDIFALSTQNGVARYRLSGAVIGTGINDIVNDNIKIKVLDGQINIEGTTASSVELFNTLGQKVKSVTNSNELRTDNLKGVYIVQVKVEGKIVRTTKVSIR